LNYLKLKRGQITLASFLFASILLTAFPAIDLSLSGLFFDGSFHLSDEWWQPLLREAMFGSLCLFMAAVVLVYARNRLAKRNVWGLDGRKVIFLFLVLVVGAGLIVNVGLKDNFGRARPRDVAEFGGSKIFTPAFVVSQECDKNCSFSSGEGAAGFYALALAFVLTRKRAILAAAAALGVLVSFARVASGAHFFSDVVVSFFVMLIVADVLFYYIVLPREKWAGSVSRTAPAVVPALR